MKNTWIIFSLLASCLGCTNKIDYINRCDCRTNACHGRTFEDISVTLEVDGKQFTIPLEAPYKRPAVIWKVTSDRVDYCLAKPKRSQSSDVCPFYWIESINLPERTSNEITEIEGMVPRYLPDSKETQKKLEVFNARCRAACDFHRDERHYDRIEGT